MTASVDLSEMDCIARRHTRDFRQVSPSRKKRGRSSNGTVEHPDFVNMAEIGSYLACPASQFWVPRQCHSGRSSFLGQTSCIHFSCVWIRSQDQRSSQPSECELLGLVTGNVSASSR